MSAKSVTARLLTHKHTSKAYTYFRTAYFVSLALEYTLEDGFDRVSTWKEQWLLHWLWTQSHLFAICWAEVLKNQH